jgi:biotin carboxylase
MTEERPTLVVLGASVSQVPALRRAREAGIRTVAVDGDPQAVGWSVADVREIVDFRDIDAVVEIARRHGADGVVAISTDRAVPVAAAVAERLGLPGVGVEVAHVMTHKGAMRSRLQAAYLPQPDFAIASDLVGARAALEQVGLPAVLKPADSGGQRGLFRIQSKDALPQRLAETLEFSRTRTAIIESYVEGRELNAIAVVRDGDVELVTLSDRLRPRGRGFGVGWCHRFPSDLEEPVQAAATSVAARAVEALGLENGIAFPQLLVERDGSVKVVEVAARIPAGQMADLVWYGVGVDLISIALDQALGRPIADDRVMSTARRPIAIRFLTARPGPLPVGRLVSVDGFDEVIAAPGILDGGLYLQQGEIIQPVRVDADRRGYVVATGRDGDAALAAADAAIARLRVTTVPADVGTGTSPARSH